MGPRGPKGTQGYPRVPKGTLGGMGPRGPLGLYRSHSEWNPFRLNGYYETTPKLKPWLESRLKGKVSKYYQNLSKIRVALGPKYFKVVPKLTIWSIWAALAPKFDDPSRRD